MTWVAVAVAGAGLVGSLIGSRGARSAAQTQASAAGDAAATQERMYLQQREDQAPWRAAGGAALGDISKGFAPGSGSAPGEAGYFNHVFGKEDLTKGLAPNYDFMLSQGLGAIGHQASAQGGVGGNSLAEAAKWATGYAGNAYQQAFANYTSTQTNIYNRLASIAGLGQTAGSNQTTGGSTYAGNIANAQIGAGNALAAGQVGSANAFSGGINNALGWYQLNNLIGPRGGGYAAADTSPISYTNPAGGSTYELGNF